MTEILHFGDNQVTSANHPSPASAEKQMPEMGGVVALPWQHIYICVCGKAAWSEHGKDCIY